MGGLIFWWVRNIFILLEACMIVKKKEEVAECFIFIYSPFIIIREQQKRKCARRITEQRFAARDVRINRK